MSFAVDAARLVAVAQVDEQQLAGATFKAGAVPHRLRSAV